MLFKWIILTVIAWYIFRAAGNLIAAAKGEAPPVQSRGPSNRDFDYSQARRHDDTSGPSIRVVKKRSADAPRTTPSASDVEDARYTDL